MPRIDINLREWDTKGPEPGSPLAGMFLDADPLTSTILDRLSRTDMLEIVELRHGL